MYEPGYHKLLWNALGAIVEHTGRNNVTSSDIIIDYLTPRQHIWVRRRDLYGAELKMNYVESTSSAAIVNKDNGMATENEVFLGNKVKFDVC